jgi:trans-2-enoyl-CoA reductase
MKQVLFERFGEPVEVAVCAEVGDPGAPGADEVRLQVLAFPINPSDLMSFTGEHGVRPTLPACPGTECVAVVDSVGKGVNDLNPGDLVVHLERGNWSEFLLAKAKNVVPVPKEMDLLQAAMLKVNPATAHLLLTDVIDLKPGDWLIQNAANSAAGKHLVRLARNKGIRTINVVRRAEVMEELYELGADVCILDGPDFAKRVRTAAKGPIRLAIDAVGGTAAKRLGYVVEEGGTVCNYGTLSGADVTASSSDLIVRAVRYVGFWLSLSLRRRDLAAVRALYAELAAMVMSRHLVAPVEAVYNMTDIGTALNHAKAGGRRGKIIVMPNPNLLSQEQRNLLV